MLLERPQNLEESETDAIFKEFWICKKSYVTLSKLLKRLSIMWFVQ